MEPIEVIGWVTLGAVVLLALGAGFSARAATMKRSERLRSLSASDARNQRRGELAGTGLTFTGAFLTAGGVAFVALNQADALPSTVWQWVIACVVCGVGFIWLVVICMEGFRQG